MAMPTERWPEFEISTVEPGRRAVHPVRAAVRTLPGGELLLVGTDISQGRRFADKFRRAMLWGIGLSTLAAALAGFWFSYRLARRVGLVASTCQRILAGEPGRRLPVAGARDEFDSLAVSVNHVLDRLEEQAGTLRATFDSAAHDLRAPLQRLRTRMDALLLRVPPLEGPVHESVESALREVDHLQRTLTTLLQIALAESGTPLASPTAVDIAALVNEIGELFEPVYAAQDLELSWQVPASRPGAGQSPAAGADAHQPDRKWPQVRPRRGSRRGERRAARRPCAGRSVADNGPGIPAEERSARRAALRALCGQHPAGGQRTGAKPGGGDRALCTAATLRFRTMRPG